MKSVFVSSWKSASSLVLTLSLILLAGCEMADGPVEIEQGQLDGTTSEDGTISIFKGIPYAAAPVGDLRWKPPAAPAGWEGVRQASAFGASCMQNLTRSRRPWTEEFMVQNDASEDCLFLNIWSPSAQSGEQLPVFVYIHGGGFGEGSGEVKMYDGTNLARKGVVVVTINYRLGVFGFFAHPELAAESEHDATGNYGLLDQVAALEWVQQNIAAFGGDPNQVTIAGQSAGAASVYYLVASSLTDGLFHRAIMQSGPGALAAFGVSGSLVGERAPAEAGGAEFAQNHGAASIADLRAVPAADLMAPMPDGLSLRFRPVVDGWFMTEDPAITYASGNPQDVPMLTGMNADEGSSSPTYGSVPAEEYRAQLQQRYGAKADQFLALYATSTDEEAGITQKQSARDLGLVALDMVMEDRAGTTSSNGYVYIFERAIPWPEYPSFGAFHTGEMPYVFDNLELLDRPWEPVDRDIAETTSSYWVNFVKQGDPNGAELPAWPAYDAENPQFMRIGEETVARGLPDENIVAFYSALLAGQ